jgi:predicted TIM-barrel fold metal-dependent hydrolase
MMIADAQVHIWAADTPERPWPPGNAHRAHRPAPFGEADLIREMDAAGVSRAIVVPPSW